MKQIRYDAEKRKILILIQALKLAESVGFQNITREMVAYEAGVSGGTVQHHFGTMGEFKAAVVQYAVQTGCLRVIGQAIAAGHVAVANLLPAVRKRALAAL
jgi:AcrR family transcriptional regulator